MILEHVTHILSFVDLLKSLVDFENSENHQVSALILKLDNSLDAASKTIKRRNKLITIADKSEAGCPAVHEYLSDAVASGSEDEKKIRAAEQRGLRKKKNVGTEVEYFYLLLLFVSFARSLFSLAFRRSYYSTADLFLLYNKFACVCFIITEFRA